MARRAGTVALALASLAMAPGAAGSAVLAPSAAPPELQALEAKMAQLNVVSERFSRLTRGSIVTTSVRSSGSGTCRPARRCRVTQHRLTTRTRHRVDISQRGEVNLAEDSAALLAGGRPRLIALGPTLYLYSPGPTRRGRARPWLRETIPGPNAPIPAPSLMPFHGQAPNEASLGGSGAWAQLINLLATASGPVVAEGPATVAGQPTLQFTATVEPGLLIAGLPPGELARIRKEIPSQQLQVYLTPAGLPLRVVTVSRSGAGRLQTSTDIVSVNTQVDVKAPPARRTRSPRHGEGSGATSIGA